VLAAPPILLSPPTVAQVDILTPHVARYEKFEAEFDVQTIAQYPDLPYDASPPPGLMPGMGVTVDVLFSSDNWQTTIVQPAFLFKPYQYSVQSDKDHFTPDGAPRWRVRFAPQVAGNWQLRIRVQDAGGTVLYPQTGALHFQVNAAGGGRYDGIRTNPYSRHGFVRVSKTDSRYFEFEDGTPFLGLGYSPSVNSLPQAEQQFRAFEQNGISFIRVWLSGAGINATQWTPWAFPKQPYNHGTPAVLMTTTPHFGNSQFSFSLNKDYPCLFADFWQNGIPVEPKTTYSVTVRAKLMDVKGTAPDSGFTVMRAGFPNQSCPETKNKPIITPVLGTTDWFTATGTFTTDAKTYWLNYLYLILNQTTQGSAYVDSIHVVAQDDPAQRDILRRPIADSHFYYESMNAAKWDRLIELAEQHGVYLKLVSDEKNEWIRNLLNAEGTILDASGKRNKFDNDNFYAAPNTEVRWLDQAWWRYLIARWGYSPAIHSYEFVNEGDPYNRKLYDATNAMASYFDSNDPSRHMVTTSFWSSYPAAEFWANPKYSAVDYADVHAYILTGWGPDASFVPKEYQETRPEYIYSGNSSFHIPAEKKIQTPIIPWDALVLSEPGEWTIRYYIKAENLKSDCVSGEGGSKLGVAWKLDGGVAKGGSEGIVPGVLDEQKIPCNAPDGTFDWREFDSQHDRDGNELPVSQRIVISDTLAHPLTMAVTNTLGVSGDAWISDVELITPAGERVPVIGRFDNTPFSKDTAWWTAAYSLLWGGNSPIGAHKPLVRGETGINSKEYPNGFPDLNQDQNGVWLHNFIWGQINSGGMYDLWWWGKENIEADAKKGRNNLYWQFLTFASFMADVPLNNGSYRDAQATSSNPDLRVWGQRDDKNGRAHLWIQNVKHTWDRVIHDEAIPAANGKISLSNMKRGTYHIEWWDTNRTRDPIIKIETLAITDTLTLTLPEPLTTDVGVKIKNVSE